MLELAQISSPCKGGGCLYIDLYHATGNIANQNTDISSILDIILPDLPILCMSHFYFLCSVEVTLS